MAAAVPPKTVGDNSTNDEDTPRSFLRFIVWVGFVIAVLVVGLGVLTFRINDKVDRINQQSINIEVSANEAEAAANKAADDLARALERAEANREQGISTEELRQVFQMVADIKAAVCVDHQELEECRDQ